MKDQAMLPPTDFSAETRRHNLIRLEQETFDLLVIGGGITGAGIASEAARRGYKVALVEKGDFASGASSKSSKLIHGGLRYLATLKFGQIFEACRQRRRLLDLAPHLVCPLPFVLPVYQNGPRPWWQIRAAMWLYDALTTFGNDSGRSWPGHQIWSASQVLAREPLLNSQGLVKAAYYYECGADDARLTLMTLLDAHRQGAVLTNYGMATGLLQARNRVVGVQVCDQLSGLEIEVKAHVVISAVGPWTDHLLRLTEAPVQRWLHPTKGVHLVVRRGRLPNQAALTFNAPHDGRFMFLVPWSSHIIIGTTDTNYSGDPDNVLATSEDVAYILEAVQQTFPSAHLNEDDIVSTYTGLRPLIRENGDSRNTPSRSNYSRSREHRICQVRPGLIAVAGGKFTTHRTMANEVVNEAARLLAREHDRFPRGFRHNPCPALPGGNVNNWAVYQTQQQAVIAAETGLPEDIARYLVATYGTEVTHLLALLLRRPTLVKRITPELPVIKAQVMHAIRYEMALTLEDVLNRRTPMMSCASDQGLGVAEAVASWMAAELGWTIEERATQVASYRHQVAMSRRWRNGSNQTC